MKLFKLETGNFKLDGGAMFGVVPKVLWNKVYPSDANNLCNLSLRCLLIQTEEKLILIDAGIGNKQSEKFFSYYYLNGADSLDKSLHAAGFLPTDVTDVILTHLHFDHCGGAVIKDSRDNYLLKFPNALHWVSKAQWNWALNPNFREKASYFKENIEPIHKSGNLRIIEKEGNFTDEISIRLFHGHSEGLIIPLIKYRHNTIVYTSDLIPTVSHLPSSWICGFDTQPLLTMKEREDFIAEAEEKKYILFFEHDIYTECCTLKKSEKGIRMDKKFTFEEFLNHANQELNI
jgi:glyoxylase-like metal-dependent hydrolase (beta-lactamase superfamily II)